MARRTLSLLLIILLFGSGYARTCEQIVGAARRLKTALRQDFAEELYVLGDPLVSVVAFSSKTLNIYIVGDMMSTRGWHLNALANPSALHLAVTVSEVVAASETPAERLFLLLAASLGERNRRVIEGPARDCRRDQAQPS